MKNLAKLIKSILGIGMIGKAAFRLHALQTEAGAAGVAFSQQGLWGDNLCLGSSASLQGDGEVLLHCYLCLQRCCLGNLPDDGFYLFIY